MPDQNSWQTYRSVILDVEAQNFVDNNSIPGNRFDDQWRAAEWLLCRKPEIGLPKNLAIPTKFLLYVISGNIISGTKGIAVLYSYDEAQVEVHGIRFVEESHEQV